MLNICSWPRGQTFSCYIHYESQQRIFPRESIKCFIRVYVGIIIDLLMYMTWNELLSTMNVKISWLYSYHTEKEEAGQEIIEYPYMHRAYYWKNISVLTSNICTVSIRSKKNKSILLYSSENDVHKNGIFINLRARIQTTMHMKHGIILFYYSHSAQFFFFVFFFNRPLCVVCSGRYQRECLICPGSMFLKQWLR